MRTAKELWLNLGDAAFIGIISGDAIDDFDTFDDTRQLVLPAELSPFRRCRPDQGKDHQRLILRTMRPDESYDVIVTRHLVGTLVDLPAAFAEWRRLLRPCGHLLMIDGDFVTPNWIARRKKMLGLKPQMHSGDAGMAKIHREILARVWFSGGAQAQEVAELSCASGFSTVQMDTDLSAIHCTRGKHLSVVCRMERGAQHRYAIIASEHYHLT